MVDTLKQGEREYVGKPDRWSAKDIVAHLAAWRTRKVQELNSIRDNSGAEQTINVDAWNAHTFRRHRHSSWNRVREFAWNAYSALHRRTLSLDEATLLSGSSRSTHKLTWPIWMLILEDAYFHPVHHLVLFYMRYCRFQKFWPEFFRKFWPV